MGKFDIYTHRELKVIKMELARQREFLKAKKPADGSPDMRLLNELRADIEEIRKKLP